jgi:hypothetical protein
MIYTVYLCPFGPSSIDHIEKFCQWVDWKSTHVLIDIGFFLVMVESGLPHRK